MPHHPAHLLPLLLTAPLLAQADRYELGLRLRDFERALAAAPVAAAADRDHRDAALRSVDRAVQAFFRLDTAGVAEAIAVATVALRGTPELPGERFARALQLDLGPRLVVAGTATLPGMLRPVFHADGGAGLQAVVQIDGCPTATATVDLAPFADGERELGFPLPIADLGPGDHLVRWSVRAGERVLVERWQGLSVAADLEARLQALAAVTEPALSIEGLTFVAMRKALGGLRRKRSEETVLPGARWLAEAEALAALPATQRYYSAPRTGDLWLTVPLGKGSATVRCFVPTPSPDGPRPVVVALHGAGGSENLFFDGYGDGEVVRQCQARGWFCVAPRAGVLGAVDVPALVAALAERWPMDRQNVLLVGHSMGAAMAISEAMRTRTAFRAVAALGGGGNLRRGAELAQLPFFVGVGSRDFARSGAVRLHELLRAAGAPATLREYPGVEHLTVVQLALPEVFAEFAKAVAAR